MRARITIITHPFFPFTAARSLFPYYVNIPVFAIEKPKRTTVEPTETVHTSHFHRESFGILYIIKSCTTCVVCASYMLNKTYEYGKTLAKSTHTICGGIAHNIHILRTIPYHTHTITIYTYTQYKYVASAEKK